MDQGRLILPAGAKIVDSEGDLTMFEREQQQIYLAGEVATTLSHIDVIKLAYARGWEQVLVLEDDVSLQYVLKWKMRMSKVLANAPKYWQLVQFLTNNPNAVKYGCSWEESTFLPRKDHYWSSAAYVVNRNGMKAIIDMTNVFDTATGQAVTRLVDPLLADHLVFGIVDVNAYLFARPLFGLDRATSADSTLGHTSSSRDTEADTRREKLEQVISLTSNYYKKGRCPISVRDGDGTRAFDEMLVGDRSTPSQSALLDHHCDFVDSGRMCNMYGACWKSLACADKRCTRDGRVCPANATDPALCSRSNMLCRIRPLRSTAPRQSELLIGLVAGARPETRRRLEAAMQRTSGGGDGGGAEQKADYAVVLYDGKVDSWINTHRMAKELGVSLTIEDAQLTERTKEGELGKIYRSRMSYQIRFLRYAIHYELLLMLDEDMGLANFDLDGFLQRHHCLWKSRPLLLQPLINTTAIGADGLKGLAQMKGLTSLKANQWMRKTEAMTLGAESSVVLSSAVLVDVEFFYWLCGRVGALLRQQSKLRSEYGIERIWCGAAKVYSEVVLREPERIACGVATLPLEHDHSGIHSVDSTLGGKRLGSQDTEMMGWMFGMYDGGGDNDMPQDWRVQVFAKYQLEHANELHRQRAQQSKTMIGPVPTAEHGSNERTRALSNFAHVGASVTMAKRCDVTRPAGEWGFTGSSEGD